jgi:vancomycin aglycone glucosyltransferase
VTFHCSICEKCVDNREVLRVRVLLSTIGSRGDVQPLMALALQLRELGHVAVVCAPPGYGELLHGFGLTYFPLGHDLRQGPRKVPGGAAATAAAQFAALRTAAAGCDAIVGAAAMQIAARSTAEMFEIPYFYAAYAPVALPSTAHSPPPVHGPPRPEGVDNRSMWDADAQWWNDTWRAGLNAQRAAIGLDPVSDVRRYMITDRPLLAADPTLAPWPLPSELEVVQTGAWLMPDNRPFSAELETFLDGGEPPILFGFGSMRTARAPASTLIAAARALGYRAIILRGWAGLSASDGAADWLSLGETNLQALLPRVAAIVHHGGSGTTTQAMRAGVPQVVVPHEFDQPYYAERVAALGIGTRHAALEPTAHSLAEALDRILTPSFTARAQTLASAVRTDGTSVAAREILSR